MSAIALIHRAHHVMVATDVFYAHAAFTAACMSLSAVADVSSTTSGAGP